MLPEEEKKVERDRKRKKEDQEQRRDRKRKIIEEEDQGQRRVIKSKEAKTDKIKVKDGFIILSLTALRLFNAYVAVCFFVYYAFVVLLFLFCVLS